MQNYLTTQDLQKRIYPEILDQITRADEPTLFEAMEAAIAEAKIYLSRYDTDALFGTESTAPTVADIFLKKLVLDIVAWHIVKLGNTNMIYEDTRTCYEDAIKLLRDIQAGKSNPPWPYHDTTGESSPPGNAIYITSGPKRTTNF